MVSLRTRHHGTRGGALSPGDKYREECIISVLGDEFFD